MENGGTVYFQSDALAGAALFVYAGIMRRLERDGIFF